MLTLRPPLGILWAWGPKGVRGWHEYSQKALQVVLRGSQTETQWAKENDLSHTACPLLPHPTSTSARVPRCSPGEDGYDATLVS